MLTLSHEATYFCYWQNSIWVPTSACTESNLGGLSKKIWGQTLSSKYHILLVTSVAESWSVDLHFPQLASKQPFGQKSWQMFRRVCFHFAFTRWWKLYYTDGTTTLPLSFKSPLRPKQFEAKAEKCLEIETYIAIIESFWKCWWWCISLKHFHERLSWNEGSTSFLSEPVGFDSSWVWLFFFLLVITNPSLLTFVQAMLTPFYALALRGMARMAFHLHSKFTII